MIARDAKFRGMPVELKLESVLETARNAGELRESTITNIWDLLRGSDAALYSEVVAELVTTNEWPELNDRFFRTLAFGTGGLRGRTIGRVVTNAERGNARDNDRPKENPLLFADEIQVLTSRAL